MVTTEAPNFRAVGHKGEVVPPPTDLAEQYCRTVALANFPALIPDAAEVQAMRDEIATLRAQLKDEQDGARVEIDNLTDLLKASGRHVRNLSTTLGMYQVERDEARDERDDLRREVEFLRESAARVTELEDLVAELKRDVDWMSRADR
jgi:septal ring factor EnvC (AmiA/AmiB activator)